MENTNKGDTLQTTVADGLTETANQKLRIEVIAEMEAETKAEAESFDAMKEMDGQEVWTNAFGERFEERVCVGIDGDLCGCNGETFKPTEKEIKQLWNDHIEQELGSSSQREADLKAEFTPEYCKQLFEEEVEERIKKKMGAN